MTLIDTDRPPIAPAKEWRARKPALLLEGDHDLCPGCTTKLRAILQNQEWGKPPALPAAV